VAPVEEHIIPLPHQIKGLTRAVSGDHICFLLADEVGLGKTIEAGLILRELKLRGKVHRVLVIVPRVLVAQWVAEMRTHFGEEFHLMVPSDFPACRRVAGDENIWRTHDQVICSMDSVKPLEGRRGWSVQDVADYNRDRYEDLIAAGWDLVIVDEPHRVGGSSDQVARYRLGQGLAEAVPYVLLLSATPHQGKTDAFRRLLSLLDSEEFADTEAVNRKKVQPFVIRAEKRSAVDSHGKPLFKPRFTRLVPILWQDRHQKQRVLYEAVSTYVREGYNRALREKKNYQGFLLILMQRLVTSSTRAIATTLERRLEVLETPDEQSLFAPVPDEEWGDLDAQEQLDAFSGSSGVASHRPPG
jgi:superfamily II DNA or RNA helicase